MVNSDLDASHYAYTNPLNSPVIDDAVYDSFHFIPPRLLASGSGNHGALRHSAADWPAPSYFEEAPSPAAFASFEPLSGRDFASAGGWAGEPDTESYNRELFAANTDDYPPYMSRSTPDRSDTQASHSDRSTPVPLPLSSQMPSESMGMPDSPIQLHVKHEPAASGSTGRVKLPTSNGINTDSGSRTRKIQLRTASRKAKHARKSSLSSPPSPNKGGNDDEDEESSLSPEERKARRSHNIVEKKYRYRLNAQFERLLAALPADDRVGDTGLRKRGSDSGDDGAMDDRRLSKAEVLDLATRRIKMLERETMLLQKDRDMLMQTVDTMSKDRR